MVSSDTLPGSASLLIFFQSQKCSHSAVTLPNRPSMPLETRMKALYQNSAGMVVLVVGDVVLEGRLQALRDGLELARRPAAGR